MKTSVCGIVDDFIESLIGKQVKLPRQRQHRTVKAVIIGDFWGGIPTRYDVTFTDGTEGRFHSWQNIEIAEEATLSDAAVDSPCPSWYNRA